MENYTNTNSTLRNLGISLLCCWAAVFVMVVLGGLTRLTGSGLSITTWGPLSGILPPLDSGHWHTLFEAYKQTPEFLHTNSFMNLEDFKSIFWLEYIHRLWGRLLGFFLLVPTIQVIKNPALRKPWIVPLLIFWILGGLQGFLGWYMVKSGLVDNPYVSPFRLAMHFMLALVLMGGLLWSALYCLIPHGTHLKRSAPAFLSHTFLPLILLGLLALTIFYGALVAGHKAGLIYTEFPLMGGELIPVEWQYLSPWWLNFFHNHATVQWSHRVLATLTLVLIFMWAIYGVLKPATRKGRTLSLSMVIIVMLQYGLGIATLLHQVPLGLATLHQMGAILLLSLLLMEVFYRQSSPMLVQETKAEL